MSDDLPIDIHSSKLLGNSLSINFNPKNTAKTLDWLVSRRHCNKDWQKSVVAIREKIKHAILDMPESPKIVELLQGAC